MIAILEQSSLFSFFIASLITPFLLGIFSSLHCVGMCGGVMSALSFAIKKEEKIGKEKNKKLIIIVFYNIGRISSYAFMGLLFGIFAEQLMRWSGFYYLRGLAGLMLIAMGLYLAGWWSGLIYLEDLGRHWWKYLQPLSKRVLPVDSAAKAFVLGGIWGWVPCGLVYSVLIYALAQGDFLTAALVMFAFGLGTLPSMMAAGFFADRLRQWLQRRMIRWLFALFIIFLGCWTWWGNSLVEFLSPDHQHEHGAHITKMN